MRKKQTIVEAYSHTVGPVIKEVPESAIAEHPLVVVQYPESQYVQSQYPKD